MKQIIRKIEIGIVNNAAFEAGIKLGALYHQFIGSPINLKTVESLENAIAQSISVQPNVRDIRVLINRDMIRLNLNDKFGYCELEGRMLTVVLSILYENVILSAKLEYNKELKYPLMYIEKIEEVLEDK